MSWNYKDGDFYVSRYGTLIFYIEENPCGCCPDSVMVEGQYLIGKKKTTSSTTSKESIEHLKNNYGLIKLD